MKTIKFLLLIMTLLISAYELKAQNAQWDDNCRSVGCDSMPQFKTLTFTLPAFPNCPLLIEYYIRPCPNGTTEIVTDRIAWGSGEDCDSLDSWLKRVGFEILNNDELYLSAYQAIAHHEFMMRYNALLAKEIETGLDLTHIYECPNGFNTFEMIRASCIQYCHYTDMVAQRSFVRQSVCNASACCKIMRHLCFNTSTNQVQSTESRTLVEQGTSCTTSTNICAPIIVNDGLPGGPRTLTPVFSTECSVGCEQEQE